MRVLIVRPLALLIVLTALVAAGCGGGDDASGASGETPAGARAPDGRTDPAATARLVLHTVEKAKSNKDCKPIRPIITRSPQKFICPPLPGVAPVKNFKIVDTAKYGTGAVIDYTTKKSPKGGSMTMFLDPERNWGIGRFGLLYGSTVGSSDEASRSGSRRAVDKYLKAVREGDCPSFNDVAVTNSPEKKVVCRDEFPQTKVLAKALKASPTAKPEYLGGNRVFGVYGLAAAEPKPRYWTITTIETAKGSIEPFAVLDAILGPPPKS
jgi:hypothetical protein